jgi:hypothetical protein
MGEAQPTYEVMRWSGSRLIFLSESEMQILKKMFLISLDKIPKDRLEERIIVGWLDSVRRAASKMKG